MYFSVNFVGRRLSQFFLCKYIDCGCIGFYHSWPYSPFFFASLLEPSLCVGCTFDWQRLLLLFSVRHCGGLLLLVVRRLALRRFANNLDSSNSEPGSGLSDKASGFGLATTVTVSWGSSYSGMWRFGLQWHAAVTLVPTVSFYVNTCESQLPFMVVPLWTVEARWVLLKLAIHVGL